MIQEIKDRWENGQELDLQMAEDHDWLIARVEELEAENAGQRESAILYEKSTHHVLEMKANRIAKLEEALKHISENYGMSIGEAKLNFRIAELEEALKACAEHGDEPLEIFRIVRKALEGK